jgi:hypothetical protein
MVHYYGGKKTFDEGWLMEADGRPPYIEESN